jgi:O-antigen/teichoic acid export membrane protein
MKSYTGKLLQGVFTRLIVSVINFLVLLLCARYLGVTSRGEISIFLFNIFLVQVVAEVFTGYSLIHFLPRFNTKKILAAGYCAAVFCAAVINGIIILAGKQVSGYEVTGTVISMLVVINTFHCIVLLSREHVRTFNLLAILQPLMLVSGIVVCVFYYRVYTFHAFLYPLIVSFLLATIISGFLMLRGQWIRTAEFSLRPILSNGFIFQGVLLMHYFCSRYSYYYLDNASQTGLYSSATALCEAALLVASGISPLLLARTANRGNSEETVSTTIFLVKAGFIFALLTMFIMIVLPEQFYLFLLGSGFAGISSIIGLYVPAVLGLSIIVPVNNYFSALGKQSVVMKCYLPSFLFSIVIMPFLVRSYGVYGAALSADAGFVTSGCLLLFAFLRMNEISFLRFCKPTSELNMVSRMREYFRRET